MLIYAIPNYGSFIPFVEAKMDNFQKERGVGFADKDTKFIKFIKAGWKILIKQFYPILINLTPMREEGTPTLTRKALLK